MKRKRKLLYLLVVLTMLVLSLPAAMPVAVEASNSVSFAPAEILSLE